MKRQYYIAGVFDVKGSQGYSSEMHMRSQKNFNRNSGPHMSEPKAAQVGLSRKKRNSRNPGDAS